MAKLDCGIRARVAKTARRRGGATVTGSARICPLARVARTKVLKEGRARLGGI
jgi:hypothetical protein